MRVKDAGKFWSRYKRLTDKDFPVLLKTGILQPTLSSWKTKKIFPRADEAVAIAAALNTSVEFLVTGKEAQQTAFPHSIQDVAHTAGILNAEGLQILAAVADSLALKYRANRKK
jgi:transcriptional regulator with XRE-family HTH domain